MPDSSRKIHLAKSSSETWRSRYCSSIFHFVLEGYCDNNAPRLASECLTPEFSPLNHIPLIHIDRTIDSAAIIINYPYTDLLSHLLFSILQLDVAVK